MILNIFYPLIIVYLLFQYKENNDREKNLQKIKHDNQ